MTETASYEENITRLEGIIRRLEQGDLSLEEALVSFETGVSLIKSCHQQLEKATQRLQVLTQDGSLAVLPTSAGEEEN